MLARLAVLSALAIGARTERIVVQVPGWPDSPLYAHAIVSRGVSAGAQPTGSLAGCCRRRGRAPPATRPYAPPRGCGLLASLPYSAR